MHSVSVDVPLRLHALLQPVYPLPVKLGTHTHTHTRSVSRSTNDTHRCPQIYHVSSDSRLRIVAGESRQAPFPLYVSPLPTHYSRRVFPATFSHIFFATPALVLASSVVPSLTPCLPASHPKSSQGGGGGMVPQPQQQAGFRSPPPGVVAAYGGGVVMNPPGPGSGAWVQRLFGQVNNGSGPWHQPRPHVVMGQGPGWAPSPQGGGSMQPKGGALVNGPPGAWQAPETARPGVASIVGGSMPNFGNTSHGSNSITSYNNSHISVSSTATAFATAAVTTTPSNNNIPDQSASKTFIAPHSTKSAGTLPAQPSVDEGGPSTPIHHLRAPGGGGGGEYGRIKGSSLGDVGGGLLEGKDWGGPGSDVVSDRGERRQSCDYCSVKKTKCSGANPCLRWVRRVPFPPWRRCACAGVADSIGLADPVLGLTAVLKVKYLRRTSVQKLISETAVEFFVSTRIVSCKAAEKGNFQAGVRREGNRFS